MKDIDLNITYKLSSFQTRLISGFNAAKSETKLNETTQKYLHTNTYM